MAMTVSMKTALMYMDNNAPLSAVRLGDKPAVYWVEEFGDRKYLVHSYTFKGTGRVSYSRLRGTILSTYRIASTKYYLHPDTLMLYPEGTIAPDIPADKRESYRAQVTRPFYLKPAITGVVKGYVPRRIRSEAPEGYSTLALSAVHYKVTEPSPEDENRIGHIHAVDLINEKGKNFKVLFTDKVTIRGIRYALVGSELKPTDSSIRNVPALNIPTK
jgi:hypothetical protein